MSKQFKREDIDEREIIASFLQDEPADHDTLVRSAESEHESRAGTSVPATPPKEEGRRRRSREPDYEALFIHGSPVTARTGKMVYIRTEFHDTIQRIVQVIGDNALSLSGFIDNVLAHHFDTYEAEITRLYEMKHRGIFDKKRKRDGT